MAKARQRPSELDNVLLQALLACLVRCMTKEVVRLYDGCAGGSRRLRRCTTTTGAQMDVGVHAGAVAGVHATLTLALSLAYTLAYTMAYTLACTVAYAGVH